MSRRTVAVGPVCMKMIVSARRYIKVDNWLAHYLGYPYPDTAGPKEFPYENMRLETQMRSNEILIALQKLYAQATIERPTNDQILIKEVQPEKIDD